MRSRQHQLNNLSRQLALQLKRLVLQVQSSRDQAAAKEQAITQARQLFEEFYTRILQHAELTAKRDLHKSRIEGLSSDDNQRLRREVDRKLAEFKKILDDATALKI